MLKFSKEIKMVVSDFDGVFTDGSLYIDENLNQQKKLSFSDIMGVSVLLKNGYKFAIISGENSPILNYFKYKFNIDEIHGGIRKKGEKLTEIMKKYSLKPKEVIYIGDDINDISAFELVEYKVAPKNANAALKEKGDIQITENYGGCGAFREIVDNLIKT